MIIIKKKKKKKKKMIKKMTIMEQRKYKQLWLWKHLQIIQISSLNNPCGIDMPLNKPNLTPP